MDVEFLTEAERGRTPLDQLDDVAYTSVENILISKGLEPVVYNQPDWLEGTRLPTEDDRVANRPVDSSPARPIPHASPVWPSPRHSPARPSFPLLSPATAGAIPDPPTSNPRPSPATASAKPDPPTSNPRPSPATASATQGPPNPSPACPNPVVPTTSLHSEPPESSNSQPDSQQDDEDTDTEIWGKSRNLERRTSDLVASTQLMEVVKENWGLINNKKESRRTVWGKIARELRGRGILITRKESDGAKKCEERFNNMKDAYKKHCKRTQKTGKGGAKEPALYKELHALLGETDENLFRF